MIKTKRINLYSGCFFMLMVLSMTCTDKRATQSSETLWHFNAPRPEIAPSHWVDHEILYEEKPTLALSGDGKSYTNGNWSLDVNVTPGKIYEFQTFFRPHSVDMPNRTILARIDWRGQDGKRISQPEYPATLWEKTGNGWNIIRQHYKVPDGAITARLELIYRWDAEGTVHFSEATLQEVQEIPTRMVNLATVHYRPRNTGSSLENLDHFSRFIGVAAEKNADIVCLPEAITLAGTGKTYIEVSEPVPGPTTEFLGKLARKYSMYIVAGLLERDGPVVYNTAVLIDRKGKLEGRYRKVALPREEIEGGVSPGDSYPVFDTDFGRVGMMICWDLEFPEVARQLAIQGAEVILMPIWGGNLTLASARSIENQVWLVSSSYNMKTGVFDLEGNLVAEANEREPVAVLKVDLNQHQYWSWLGDLKNRIPRERPDWMDPDKRD